MRRIWTALPLLLLILLAAPAAAQMPSPAAQAAEMKKLQQMIGRWEGTGWIDGPEGHRTFRGAETVQSKINGLALLVEGKFFNTSPGAKPDEVIHETLGVVHYDERGKVYRLVANLASGMKGDYELRLVEGGWQWFINFPGGQVRYTTKFNTGSWVETGEMTRDNGQTWRKFFEMTLKRAG
jgi:hypothetical protein